MCWAEKRGWWIHTSFLSGHLCKAEECKNAARLTFCTFPPSALQNTADRNTFTQHDVRITTDKTRRHVLQQLRAFTVSLKASSSDRLLRLLWDQTGEPSSLGSNRKHSGKHRRSTRRRNQTLCITAERWSAGPHRYLISQFSCCRFSLKSNNSSGFLFCSWTLFSFLNFLLRQPPGWAANRLQHQYFVLFYLTSFFNSVFGVLSPSLTLKLCFVVFASSF